MCIERLQNKLDEKENVKSEPFLIKLCIKGEISIFVFQKKSV